MSFQHFRLGELALQQPLPPHLTQHQPSVPPSASAFATLNPTNQTLAANPPKSLSGKPKQPYGSGDSDDGYTLMFPNLAAFQEWRAQEEERQSVEFVKGDTHGSKAVPPRFKDHTKLVCARHSRSGRKKYVKKHPERIRKVPSRKLEGQGCPASISYKTYFDTDEVRACYQSQHSHDIGLANLPYTRRGRRAAAALREKDPKTATSNTPVETPQSAPPAPNVVADSTPAPQPPSNMFTSSVSMIAPLPGQPQPQYQPQPFTYAPVPQQFPPPLPTTIHSAMSHDRWENMATLFSSIREHARGFEYPSVSVAALETVLIRLYLESPVGLGAQPTMAALLQNQAASSQMNGPRLPNAAASGSGRSNDTSDGNGNGEESS